MTDTQLRDQKNFTSSLISALSLMTRVPTREEVEKKARGLAAVTDYEGDLKVIIDEAMIAVVTRMGAGVSLVDPEADHDEEWVFKREDMSRTYSEAYEGFLKSEGWHPNVVQSLSDVGTRILGHLQDPTSDGSWNRRGLVIGHVQSGKTANYMGVIAKAADAGYRFIIVIAGIHNNLRRQTQERIDEGFIGRSSDPDNRVPIGVGLSGGYPHPATLTNIYDDFNKVTAKKSGWKINDFSKPIILVIKKNVTTLTALHKWLKELNAQGDGRIVDVPMLMIDDEADNASINTNKPDLDPTRTNAMIRQILGLFAKSCYVGYTATPFANIFINPEAYNERDRDELFPRDFIYSLDAPTTYFGPHKVFLNEDTSERILQPITDCEEYIPFSLKKDDTVQELPPSLYRALHQFIIARAIRNLRGQSRKHCSMMINVSRFVSVQKQVREFISVHEKKLREAVKANYAMPDSSSQRNAHMIALRLVFEEDFPTSEFDWARVKSALWSVFENLRIFVVNSKSDEALDYRKYERDGQGLTAIAIGGLSLSRGLTVEGLCISYMYRNTKMYDTLMQMGRWFGYRPGFEDLCRVHLAPDSIRWYSYIANASDELRSQIRRMRQDGLSPKQFGLYVLSHPDQLLITATNKMRSGKKIVVNQNFSGRIVESYILPTDTIVSQANEKLIAEYWKSGFGQNLEPTDKGWVAKNVGIEVIEEFLTRFQTHSSYSAVRTAAVSYLQVLSDRYPTGDVLLISIDKNGGNAAEYRLGHQERAWEEENSKPWKTAKYRVASRGDEKLGLSDPQLNRAEHDADSEDPPVQPSDTHYRAVRNKPLLMIHVLKPKAKGEQAAPDVRVPAFGISFPPGHYTTEIEVVANPVWLAMMQGAYSDDPNDDEDYDE